MKKSLLLFSTLFFFATTFATSIIEPAPKLRADEIFIPLGKSGKMISLDELSTLNMKGIEKIAGKKMNFTQRMSIKAAQHKLRQAINNDGTINSKKVTNWIKRAKGGETGFHLGGFALGFFVGLIGVLIAYIIDDDYKRNRVKWAWIGLALGFVISLILILVVLDSAGI